MKKRKNAEKRRLELIDDEKEQVQKSDVFLNSCHLLIGPVSSTRLASLTIKVLKFASERLAPTDFQSLCGALELLQSDPMIDFDLVSPPDKRVEEIGNQIAHACRMHPELMGLLCAILPASVSLSSSLRESNESLRAVREFCLSCTACDSDPCLLTQSTPGSSILKRAKLSNRPYLRTLLANLQSDTAPEGDLYPEIEFVDFEHWQDSKTVHFTHFPSL